jgi:hypothetical protein
MIASRSGGGRLPRVMWRHTARRSLRVLMDFLKASGCADSDARRKEIEDAVESLRHSPLRCVVVGLKGGLTFRRLVVNGRFYVYYVYTPPRGMSSCGTLSIRSVKHAGSQNPFLDVRETLASHQPLGALNTRDSAEPLATV